MIEGTIYQLRNVNPLALFRLGMLYSINIGESYGRRVHAAGHLLHTCLLARPAITLRPVPVFLSLESSPRA
jgi:hypothetical protein